MKAVLYRYPHPHIEGKWIYVGQTLAKKRNARDKSHRRGGLGFGANFKRRFPGIELPQPTREIVEVENQLELNGLEIVWMFQYHTWHGYEGGMNLTLPGSQDYKKISSLAGNISGRMNVENGHLDRIRKLPQTIAASIENGKRLGRWAVQSGLLARIRELPQSKAAMSRSGKINGRKSKENKTGLFSLTLEQKQAAGRKGGPIGGRATAASTNGRKGRCARQNGLKAFELKVGVHGFTKQRRIEIGKKAGAINVKNKSGIFSPEYVEKNADRIKEWGQLKGRENVESGHLDRIRAKAVLTRVHSVSHIKCNRPNIRCVLCSEQNLVIAWG
jgi:hypothetical protein